MKHPHSKNRSGAVASAVLALTLGMPGLTHAEVAVVVSAKSAVGSLTPEQVSAIFMGKNNAFPGGGTAVPIDQSEGAAPRAEFYSKVVGKDDAQMKAYWSRIVFTGKGSPPKDFANSAEIKRQLASNPNAIGYIDKAAVDATVKVVLSAP